MYDWTSILHARFYSILASPGWRKGQKICCRRRCFCCQVIIWGTEGEKSRHKCKLNPFGLNISNPHWAPPPSLSHAYQTRVFSRAHFAIIQILWSEEIKDDGNEDNDDDDDAEGLESHLILLLLLALPFTWWHCSGYNLYRTNPLHLFTQNTRLKIAPHDTQTGAAICCMSPRGGNCSDGVFMDFNLTMHLLLIRVTIIGGTSSEWGDRNMSTTVTVGWRFFNGIVQQQEEVYPFIIVCVKGL